MSTFTDSMGTTTDRLPRVFITDSSAAVTERLVASIDDVAQAVGRATNARDAISGMRQSQPNLAVLDVGITNGLDLLKRTKLLLPPIIVVVLTHSTEEVTRQACLRLGAEYFLDKLFDFDKVREIVIAIGDRLPPIEN